ncbi:M20/M25/M40 family metallo-hydrolase, partial [Enterococcus faecalis]|uniref:M20/M25/M40 family metallo-hydrolase n=1 Tax=Enterococcus faecalis TaxID=1351 RepID=UPI003CC54075
LVTAAKVLKEIQEELQGRVRLIFQPSEVNAQGAKAMVAQGAMTGVDDVFGLHIRSQMPVGTASCGVGRILGSARIFLVAFK